MGQRLPPSRFDLALQSRAAVERDGEGVYRVGPFAAGLGAGSTPPVATIESLAAETVAALASDLDEASCISVPVGHETLTLMQVAVPKPVQAEDWTGHRWSMTSGGSGAAMMATWPDRRVEPLLSALAGDHRAAIEDEIAVARRSGVSWSHGSHVEGLSSVAAPILGPDGTAVAAVLGYGPSYRFPGKGRVRAVAAMVADAGRTITDNLRS